MEKEINHDKYKMYFNTVQGTSVKTLAEALKEVLQDINIHFNSDGVEIVNVDPKHISFVSLKLHAKKFEDYYCPNPLTVGINMLTLHKLLKTIGNNDILIMFVTKDNPDKLGITIHNKKKRINNEITYNLKDIDDIEIDIPKIDFAAQITIPCSDFQKYCRELATVSDYVQLKINQDKIFTMTVNGKFASQTLDIQESEDSNIIINIDKTIDGPVDIGTFDLKFLNLFCKSSTLCSTIQLKMTPTFPIFIEYAVASLGTVNFCLVQKSDDSGENKSNDSDDE